MKIHVPVLVVMLLLPHLQLGAQAPKAYSSADILEMIQKLNVLGTVVYVAAHPDDENTSMISYLANERKVDVYYLSMTRGDGGQNLIGPEIRDLLGVLRTQELMAARRIDGGHQMFTRANDFGYSKTADETMHIWGKEAMLSDVVWALRKLQPDVIINRFDHRRPQGNHGHHVASAILALDAFDLSNDRTKYPEQLKWVQPWQPTRIFLNTSWWWYGSEEAFAKIDKSFMWSVDIGTYYPLKGKSNTEISAESRSQHKCQGFGVLGTRGNRPEYLELLKGDKPSGKDFLDGVNTSWSRIPGGEIIGKKITALEKNYQFNRPDASLPALLEVRKMIAQLPAGLWKERKLALTDQIITAALGLYAEVFANQSNGVPGDSLEINLELVNRSSAPVKLSRAEIQPGHTSLVWTTSLAPNVSQTYKAKVLIPHNLSITNAYWLNEKPLPGRFQVPNPEQIGLPETPREFQVNFHLDVLGEPLVLPQTIVFKKRDPVKGEVFQPFEIVHPVYLNLPEKGTVFYGGMSKEIKLKVKAVQDGLKGVARLEAPAAWKIVPAEQPFNFSRQGEEKIFTFMVTPPKESLESNVVAYALVDGQRYDREWLEIAYDHIPLQTITPRSEATWAHVELHRSGQQVGYIAGAGDEVPASLSQMGYQVTHLQPTAWNLANFRKFDAIILGVRAYNTEDKLEFVMPELYQYVEQGGNLIVQYNTTGNLKVSNPGPYPLKIGRERITEETAQVTLLAPEHPVLNYPNKISSKDFDGWVQERALYVPNQWDARYTPIISCHDQGEKPLDGSLLVAHHGRGYFVYTGLAFFRQLPAGVPGAYRLFANMVSLGKTDKP